MGWGITVSKLDSCGASSRAINQEWLPLLASLSSGLTLLEGINWISRDSQGLTLQWSGSRRRSLTCGFRGSSDGSSAGRAKRIGSFAKRFEFALKISILLDLFELLSVELSYKGEEKDAAILAVTVKNGLFFIRQSCNPSVSFWPLCIWPYGLFTDMLFGKSVNWPYVQYYTGHWSQHITASL